MGVSVIANNRKSFTLVVLNIAVYGNRPGDFIPELKTVRNSFILVILDIAVYSNKFSNFSLKLRTIIYSNILILLIIATLFYFLFLIRFINFINLSLNFITILLNNLLFNFYKPSRF